MADLNEFRAQITDIDQQIAELFEKRMQLVKKVSLYKISNNIQTEDKKREANMLTLYSSYINDSQLLPYYITLLNCYISVSKDYQDSIKQSQ